MLETTRAFLSAVENEGYKSSEYVYVLPWIQSGQKDELPWVASSGERMQKVKDNFDNAIVVLANTYVFFTGTVIKVKQKTLTAYGRR